MTTQTAATDDVTRALLEVVRSISGEPDGRAVLCRIVEAAVTTTGASRGALEIVDAHGVVRDVVTSLTISVQSASSIRVAARSRGTVVGHLCLTGDDTGKNLGPVDAELVTALADAAAAVIDRTETARLGERRRRWLEATAALSEACQPPFVLERALREITNRVALLSGALGASIVQTATAGSPDAGLLPAYGLDDDAVASSIESAVRHLSVHGMPVDDVELDAVGATTVLVPLRSHVADGGVLAVVFADSASARDVEGRELLYSFAEQAGLALDRAQALEDRRSLAIVTERDRVARDLHDVVMQRLFATGMHLQGVRLVAGDDVAERLDEAMNHLDETIKDIRSTIFRLESAH